MQSFRIQCCLTQQGQSNNKEKGLSRFGVSNLVANFNGNSKCLEESRCSMMQYRFQISPTSQIQVYKLQIQFNLVYDNNRSTKRNANQNTNNILLPQDLSRCGQISFLKQLLTAVAFFLLKIESLVWLGNAKKYKLSILPKYQ